MKAPSTLLTLLAFAVSPALACCPGQSGSASSDPGQSGSASYFDPGQSGSASSDPGQSGSASSNPGQSGSASFDPGQSGSADPGQTGSSQPPSPPSPRVTREDRSGVVVRDETAYVVRDKKAQPIDAALIPPGRMLTKDGDLVAVPRDVAGLTAPAGVGAATVSADSGIVLQDGKIYMVHDGKTTPVNATTVPPGRILTFEGDLLKAPKRTSTLE